MNTINTQTYMISSKYPFLKNFPFKEFSIEIGQNSSDNTENQSVNPILIKFTYEKDKSSMTIFIFEQELTFINKVSEKITELDLLAKVINDALASPELLIKRDAVLFAEKWCSQLKDNRSKLSYSTSNEILISLVGSHSELVTIINKIGKLQLVQGVVGLTEKEYAITLTYYQYQLIYAKLLLGLVISSKISL